MRSIMKGSIKTDVTHVKNNGDSKRHVGSFHWFVIASTLNSIYDPQGALTASGAGTFIRRWAMRMGPQADGLDLITKLDPNQTALLVIDVQNDFCHPEGVFGRAGFDLSTMPAMAATLRGLLVETRRLQLFTVFIRATYDDVVLSPNLSDIYHRRGFTNSLCLEDSWGAAWYGEVEPNSAPHEVVLTKHRYSAFDQFRPCLRSTASTSSHRRDRWLCRPIARAMRSSATTGGGADAVADATADTHAASLRKSTVLRRGCRCRNFSEPCKRSRKHAVWDCLTARVARAA